MLRVNCAKMTRLQIDQDNLRMRFLALNVDFSSLSLGSKKPEHASVKQGYRFKSGYFTAIGFFSVKNCCR